MKWLIISLALYLIFRFLKKTFQPPKDLLNLSDLKSEDKTFLEIEMPAETQPSSEVRSGKITSFDLLQMYRNGEIPNKIQLQAIDLSGSVLPKINLKQANLKGANLSQVDLRGADLSGAVLENACLKGAMLKGADLSGANLKGADLSEAIFDKASLYEANLVSTNLTRTSFVETRLIKANLRGAKLYGTSLDKAYLCKTTSPEGKELNKDCSKAGA